MKILRTTLTLSLLLLAACQSNLDLRYLDATVGGSLELPPDLIRSEAESSFELPAVFAGDDETVRNRIPVLAKVESLKLEGSGNLHWLSVEEPVDNLYQLVKNFWASEGYRLTVDEPVIGIMQTEWIYKEVGATGGDGGNWLENLFGNQDLSATQDQFKIRIERAEDGKSRVYVAHRGFEYKYVLDTNQRSNPLIEGDEPNDDWQPRRPDPELEVEMLSRMMIYLGLQKSDVEQQVANVKLFKPRAYMQLDSEENSPFLLLKDAYQIAWNRVYQNLERLNFEIKSAEFKSGLSQEGVFIVDIDVKDSQKQGGLFSLVSAADTTRREILLILSEETHEYTRVEIENEKGEVDTSPEGAEFLALLYQNIK